jgi:hypothetical protein
MGPAERQRHVVAAADLPVARIAVDLQDAAETEEMRLRPLGLAIGRVDEGNRRRISAAPWSIIASIATCKRPTSSQHLSRALWARRQMATVTSKSTAGRAALSYA